MAGRFWFEILLCVSGSTVALYWIVNRAQLLKVIPQYCIAHPYCARFLASLART